MLLLYYTGGIRAICVSFYIEPLVHHIPGRLEEEEAVMKPQLAPTSQVRERGSSASRLGSYLVPALSPIATAGQRQDGSPDRLLALKALSYSVSSRRVVP
ncbi:hypothetical protein NHX12_009492 [Muraenolepis orangiensis]|uniref:Uncharacterized protein n=1 Tax=Muraenolepis orangiensis TaxID=630683 RepID=A0A9Q0DHQ5_9TELE|nr:hypothetical protein NHX12_009492 [Muraenolepis orangiensis]